MNENNEGYQHFIPMVKEDPEWLSKLSLHLVSSIDELLSIVS